MVTNLFESAIAENEVNEFFGQGDLALTTKDIINALTWEVTQGVMQNNLTQTLNYLMKLS